MTMSASQKNTKDIEKGQGGNCMYTCESLNIQISDASYVYMQSAKDVGNALHARVKTARSVQTVRTRRNMEGQEQKSSAVSGKDV